MYLQWEYLNEYASKWTEEFRSAEPFQHICIDNAWKNDSLDQILSEHEAIDWKGQDVRHDSGVQVKGRTNWTDDEEVPPITRQCIGLLNSGNFLRWLTQITGVSGLICDPYLSGGGLNRIERDGLLAVHADGNWHDHMAVHRRINVIIFLNKDWDDDWGGHLEFWDRDRTKCVKKISPLFNRMVIFKTDDFSMHGHPHPLACPEDRSRRSLILYYYTSTRPAEELASSDKHRAIFYPEVTGK
ncbi:MAG: 2OG-Fe(II) oxygenase [Candidatus Thorarchaeota archaeon]|jgi:hypothetical protein